MGLGPTHYIWRGDVARIVGLIEDRWPDVKCNTYAAHPWRGWSHVSIDVWAKAGRGFPIDLRTGWEVRQFVMQLPGEPYLRHTIYLHQLWTSFGGISRWSPADHSGRLRHLHLTYWK